MLCAPFMDYYYFCFYFIMILLSIYIYNWIGNKFLQLTSPSPYKYINSINKSNDSKYIIFPVFSNFMFLKVTISRVLQLVHVGEVV